MDNEIHQAIEARIAGLKQERDEFIARNYSAILQINQTMSNYESVIMELEKLIDKRQKES